MDYACPWCGHESPVRGSPLAQLLRCNECGTGVAYGVAMPSVRAISHPEDDRFIAIVIESRNAERPGRLVISVERGYGVHIAESLMAACRPPEMAPGLAPDAENGTVTP